MFDYRKNELEKHKDSLLDLLLKAKIQKELRIENVLDFYKKKKNYTG